MAHPLNPMPTPNTESTASVTPEVARIELQDWTVGNFNDACEPAEIPIVTSDRWFASVFVEDDSEGYEEEKIARLIAAAPELLEALKGLLAGPAWPGAQMTAQAAIAKAEG